MYTVQANYLIQTSLFKLLAYMYMPTVTCRSCIIKQAQIAKKYSQYKELNFHLSNSLQILKSIKHLFHHPTIATQLYLETRDSYM